MNAPRKHSFSAIRTFPNQSEQKVRTLVSQVPNGARVTYTMMTPKGSRIPFFVHLVDRPCIGRCFVYENYAGACFSGAIAGEPIRQDADCARERGTPARPVKRSPKKHDPMYPVDRNLGDINSRKHHCNAELTRRITRNNAGGDLRPAACDARSNLVCRVVKVSPNSLIPKGNAQSLVAENGLAR